MTFQHFMKKELPMLTISIETKDEVFNLDDLLFTLYENSSLFLFAFLMT